MIYNSETGNSSYTPMLWETDDIFSNQVAASRNDAVVAKEYIEEQHFALAKDFDAQDKLTAINLSHYGLINQFQLGFGDSSFIDSLSKDCSGEKDSLRRLRLIDSFDKGIFDGFIIFPLYNGIYYIPVGAYGYILNPKEGYEPDLVRFWNKEAAGIFNMSAVNAFSDLVVCQSPITACQLIERGIENVVAVRGNGDIAKQFYEMFKHLPTQSVRLISEGDRYGLHWKEQISEAMRWLNIECNDFFDA